MHACVFCIQTHTSSSQLTVACLDAFVAEIKRWEVNTAAFCEWTCLCQHGCTNSVWSCPGSINLDKDVSGLTLKLWAGLCCLFLTSKVFVLFASRCVHLCFCFLLFSSSLNSSFSRLFFFVLFVLLSLFLPSHFNILLSFKTSAYT